VLTEHGAESLGPSATARASHARRRAGLALTLSLALHAALLAALGWSAQAREPTRAAVTFLPLVVIHEEPALAAPPAPQHAPQARRPAAKRTPPAPAPPPRAPLAEPAPLPPPVRAEAPAPPPVAAGPPAAPPAGTGGLALHALTQPLPRYPRAARLRGAEGTAWLRVDVAPSGRVRRVELERSAGHRDLDRAALAAVRRWLFAPLPEGMDRSDRWFRVPVEFRLR
jgi:protein TonB